MYMPCACERTILSSEEYKLTNTKRLSTSSFRGISEELEESPLFHDDALPENESSVSSPRETFGDLSVPVTVGPHHDTPTALTESVDEPNQC